MYPSALDALVNPNGSDTTLAVNHAAQHTNANNAIMALEAKLGIGASLATAGKLLRGTGAGESAWDKDAPNGVIVGTTDSQTLTNKTLTSPVLNSAIINNPSLLIDTISEFTPAAGVTIDGLLLKDGKLGTNDSVVTANITNAAITPEKLFAGTGGSWPWASYTPTWTNVTVGNGTVNAFYKQIGKTVTGMVQLICGSTTAINNSIRLTLPVTAHARYNSTGYNPVGNVISHDISANVYAGTASLSGSPVTLEIIFTNGSTYTGTFPYTETTNDTLNIEFCYEAA